MYIWACVSIYTSMFLKKSYKIHTFISFWEERLVRTEHKSSMYVLAFLWNKSSRRNFKRDGRRKKKFFCSPADTDCHSQHYCLGSENFIRFLIQAPVRSSVRMTDDMCIRLSWFTGSSYSVTSYSPSNIYFNNVYI